MISEDDSDAILTGDEGKNILVLDTSTKACVLGLSCRGQFKDATAILGRTHSEKILPNIVGLLARAGLLVADLDLIVFGRGPGSFTGLRIGIGVVQGLTFGLDIPAVGVSSIACMAQLAYRKGARKNCMVALLARNEEVYYGAYANRNGIMTSIQAEGVKDASLMPKQSEAGSWAGVGDGWVFQSKMEPALGIRVDIVFEDIYPEAIDLLTLGVAASRAGLQVMGASIQPEYLRERVASIPKKMH